MNVAGLEVKFKYLDGQYKKEADYLKKIKKNQKKYPKDTYILFDCLGGDMAECIDAYSLFRYMKDAGKKAYYVIMEMSPLYEKLKAENNLDGIIPLKNTMYTHPGDFLEITYELLLRAKVVISSFGIYSRPMNKFIVKNPYIKYFFIQHGQIFIPIRMVLAGYFNADNSDKFLISSEKEYEILKQYNFPENKLIKSGLPRWDLLEQTPDCSEEKSIFIMFSWRRLTCDNFDNSLYKQNLLKFLSNKELKNYLKEKNVKVYFAAHHALKGLQGIDFNVDLDNIIQVDSGNVSKYIRKCSCLITDTSSVAFDFMFQNKPVIFYLLDKGDENLEDIERDGFDYFYTSNKDVLPDIYLDEQDVIEKIKHYTENGFQLGESTKNIYSQYFYIKNNIRQNLTEQIDKICSSCD